MSPYQSPQSVLTESAQPAGTGLRWASGLLSGLYIILMAFASVIIVFVLPQPTPTGRMNLPGMMGSAIGFLILVIPHIFGIRAALRPTARNLLRSALSYGLYILLWSGMVIYMAFELEATTTPDMPYGLRLVTIWLVLDLPALLAVYLVCTVKPQATVATEAQASPAVE